MKRTLSTPPAFLCLVALIALAPTIAARAQENEPEITLPACGIRYPGGYDPNTVGVVEGRIAAFNLPERGPVSFRIEAGRETYTVLAAPSWYWKDQRFTIESSDRVRVKGSKTMGADGNLYLVAQEISVAGGGKPIILRDTLGKPAWPGCGPEGCAKHRR